MTLSNHAIRRLAGVAIALIWASAIPASVAAHAELERATPPDGGTVAAPFDGPIRLEFTEDLADGSNAELQDDGGGAIADATVDGPGATMEFVLDAPLGPGNYRITWTGLGADGHVERGTVAFTVEAAPPTPKPTPSPSPTPEPSESVAPATPAPEPSPEPTPPPSPTPTAAASSGDMVLPIVVALVVVALGGGYLLSRRGRPTP